MDCLMLWNYDQWHLKYLYLKKLPRFDKIKMMNGADVIGGVCVCIYIKLHLYV